MSAGKTIDDYYPQDCPFCAIANTYPYRPSRTGGTNRSKWLDSVPDEELVQELFAAPTLKAACFPILASEGVLAFLDIMPMTWGHLLVTSRNHRSKVGDMTSAEAADVGMWLPIIARVLARVTGCSDYNIVQNNGARAAQVVPHVHFHFIPRDTDLRAMQAQSWTMFGKGQRDDLDDDEGNELAAELRRELRREIQKLTDSKALL